MMENVKRILLIEDNAAEGGLVQAALEQSPLSCQIDWVRTLDAGLAKLRALDYQAVLTNLLLPDRNGLDTLRCLRQENRAVPIIVMTGNLDGDMEVAVMAQGATDYLRKAEATPCKLTRTLERAIEYAAQRDQAERVVRSLTEELQARTEMVSRQQKLLSRKNQRLHALHQTAHRFIDSLSSELRTPLTVIKDYLSLVRDELVGPVNDEQRRMLDVASVRADDLSNKIGDLLDVSKIESGTVSAWRRRCRLEDVLHQIRPAILQKAKVKDIEVELDVAGEFPDLYCDAEMIGRALMNVAAAAMKAQGIAGRLRIWARTHLLEGEVSIGVEDLSGRFCPLEAQSIFEPFEETKSQFRCTNRAAKLGESIAKELVSLNYGTMHAEHEFGVSSNLWFTVPICDPRQVFERYLHHEAARQPGFSLSMVECSVPVGLNETTMGDLDCFFQCLLRRHDIVFRTHESQWVLVLLVPAEELSLFLARMASKFEFTNSQRHADVLPPFTVVSRGNWEIPAETEQAVRTFQTLLPDVANSQPATV